MGKKFQKKKEDFVCDKCGLFVEGSGYTNHCPRCLWSKHVDEFPGDRKSQCKGLMRPAQVTLKFGEYIIIHRCEKCGWEKRNKAAKDDNTDKIPEIVKGKGAIPVTHVASNEEYRRKLNAKLQEEVDEFLEDSNEEELADILEVIYALCDLYKIDKDKLEHLRKEKVERRGGFKDKIILDETKE